MRLRSVDDEPCRGRARRSGRTAWSAGLATGSSNENSEPPPAGAPAAGPAGAAPAPAAAN